MTILNVQKSFAIRRTVVERNRLRRLAQLPLLDEGTEILKAEQQAELNAFYAEMESLGLREALETKWIARVRRRRSEPQWRPNAVERVGLGHHVYAVLERIVASRRREEGRHPYVVRPTGTIAYGSARKDR